MTPITIEQAETLANKHSVGSGGNCTVDLPALLTDFRQQVIADLARESEVMPQIQEVGTRHWSELIYIPDEVRESIASLQAKLEQSEARRLELEGIRAEAGKMADDYLEMSAKLGQFEARARELEKDAARLDALERNVLECRGKLQIACTPGNLRNLLDGVINDYAAVIAALNKEPGHEA